MPCDARGTLFPKDKESEDRAIVLLHSGLHSFLIELSSSNFIFNNDTVHWGYLTNLLT